MSSRLLQLNQSQANKTVTERSLDIVDSSYTEQEQGVQQPQITTKFQSKIRPLHYRANA